MRQIVTTSTENSFAPHPSKEFTELQNRTRKLKEKKLKKFFQQRCSEAEERVNTITTSMKSNKNSQKKMLKKIRKAENRIKKTRQLIKSFNTVVMHIGKIQAAHHLSVALQRLTKIETELHQH